jgi:hypothetical protein
LIAICIKKPFIIIITAFYGACCIAFGIAGAKFDLSVVVVVVFTELKKRLPSKRLPVYSAVC